MTALLITANLGSLFEAPEHFMAPLLAEISQVRGHWRHRASGTGDPLF
jgi:hypothetical protein